MNRLYYSPQQVTRMLALKRGQLRAWQRQGLFPERSRYGWADLQRAQVLARCAAAAISPQRMRRSLRAACERLSELRDPWLEASFKVFAGRLEVVHAGFHMDALTGQLRLPFEVHTGAAAVAEARVEGRDQAEQWFSFGLSLEGNADMREQAIAAYERCLELDPGFGSALINLGTLHYHGKNYSAAERCYYTAIELDRNYALAHFNLGNVLDETGRLEAAVTAYSEAVRLVPGYADAHYNLALAYQRLGQIRKAVPHWRQYLGLDKLSPWALHARTQLKQALERDVLRLVASEQAQARR